MGSLIVGDIMKSNLGAFYRVSLPNNTDLLYILVGCFLSKISGIDPSLKLYLKAFFYFFFVLNLFSNFKFHF